MILTDTPVKNALEAEAAKRQAKVKRTTSRKVARMLIYTTKIGTFVCPPRIS